MQLPSTNLLDWTNPLSPISPYNPAHPLNPVNQANNATLYASTSVQYCDSSCIHANDAILTVMGWVAAVACAVIVTAGMIGRRRPATNRYAEDIYED